MSSFHITINEEMRFQIKEQQAGTCESSLSSPSIVKSISHDSSSDDIFSSYSTSQLPFPSLMSQVSQERRILIQDEIEKEFQKELQTLKDEKAVPISPLKGLPSVRRQQHAERNNKAIHRLFEREHKKYAELEKEYWEVLMTPFPTEFNLIEAYKKREKVLEVRLGDCQYRLDEIFRRKYIADKEPSFSFTTTRKLSKIFKSRR